MSSANSPQIDKDGFFPPKFIVTSHVDTADLSYNIINA